MRGIAFDPILFRNAVGMESPPHITGIFNTLVDKSLVESASRSGRRADKGDTECLAFLYPFSVGAHRLLGSHFCHGHYLHGTPQR